MRRIASGFEPLPLGGEAGRSAACGRASAAKRWLGSLNVSRAAEAAWRASRADLGSRPVSCLRQRCGLPSGEEPYPMKRPLILQTLSLALAITGTPHWGFAADHGDVPAAGNDP